MPQERVRLTNLFRKEVFEAYSDSEEYGMVFTFMWALDCKEDWDYIDMVEEMFKAKGGTIYFVELEADYDVRIERNKTENRLLNKPTKRDITRSEKLFRSLEEKYRLNSFEDEIKKNNYVKINNTYISPDVVAHMISDQFKL